MSHSYKKAIFKDSGIARKAYHRIVRRHNGTILKTKIKHNILLDNTEIEIELKDAKTIVNSYNYCDWKTNWEQNTKLKKLLSQEQLNKWRRK
jgi:hypothetical protein